MTKTIGARKHAQVFTLLLHEIESGRWKEGQRLPSEAQLVDQLGLSRITVGRAMRDLQVAGLIERRVGSGTYVKSAPPNTGHTFGLLIPALGETEIFEPICQGMMASPRAREHALVWGSVDEHADSQEAQALALCRHYIDRKVTGVFFAPLEGTPAAREVNQRVCRELEGAGIPIVFLDRGPQSYLEPNGHDLVGIDNRRAGFRITQHLLKQGCRRLAFVSVAHAASTVAARQAGFRDAISTETTSAEPVLSFQLDPDSSDQVRHVMDAGPDGLVCANDRTAGRLMQTLGRLGYGIPGDVRLVGVDDVEYARLLPVPLTTLRQPTREIGEAALGAMLDRIARPTLRPRQILIDCDLIVRRSCGSSAA